MSLLSENLDRGVLVYRHGAGGDEELLDGSVLLVDGDHAGLEDGQGGDVVGQNTEGSGEGRNVNLRSGVG